MQKIRQHSLIKNILAYVSGDVLQKTLNFMLVPIWVRFLSPEEYGIFGALVAYGGMATAILSMGLPPAIIRNYYDYLEDDKSQKAYITSVMYFLICVMTLVVLVASHWGEVAWLNLTSGNIHFNPFVRLTLITILANTVNQTIASVYQAQQKAKSFLRLQYSRFIAIALLTAISVIWLDLGALGMIASQALGGIVVACTAMFFFSKEWFINIIQWEYIKSGLAYGLPLVPHTASLWTLQSSDRLILEFHVSLSELGIYNLGYTLGLVLTFLVQGVNRGWAPFFYRLIQVEKEPQHKIIKFALIYFLGFSTISLFGILFANELVYLIFPASYYEAERIIAPVLFGALMSALYLFVSKPIWYLKLTKVAPRISISAALLNIGLNVWWIPIFGSIAAAWSTVLAYTLMFIWYLMLAQKNFPIAYQYSLYGTLLIFVLCITLLVQLPFFDLISFSVIATKTGLFLAYLFLSYRLMRKEDAFEELLSQLKV